MSGTLDYGLTDGLPCGWVVHELEWSIHTGHRATGFGGNVGSSLLLKIAWSTSSL